MRRPLISTILICIVFLYSVSLHGTVLGSPEDVQQKVTKTREEISELEGVIKALDDSITSRLARIEELNSECEKTEWILQETIEQLAQSESRLNENNRVFAARVRSTYIKGGFSYLDMFMEAESFGDFVIRLAYLTRTLNRDAQIIEAVRQEQAIFEDKKTVMQKQNETLLDLRYQLDTEQRNLSEQRREMDVLLAAAKERLAGELALITPQAERKVVYAIAIDNAPQARPQHGLAKASLVYEYEVEGRITRYLAFFSAFPVKVGPIRSARSHSSMLALENSVNFIYASAGVDVLAKIKDWGVNETNALYYKSASFYRDSSRRAPHNLYVNLSTLGIEQQSRDVVIRPAYLSREGTPAPAVSLSYSQNYKVRYDYIPARGIYRRHINGQVHKDATGEAINVRNIIIQYAPHGFDLIGRPTPDIVGEGIIDFYSQGQHFKGVWKKESIASLTRFYYEDGQEIERVYGQTWIQIARNR
jgi:peptidoglycan hydrolase CwlO-like protein